MNSRLVARWAEVVRSRSEHPAVLDDDEVVSFEALGQRTARLASALVARGLTGKRVALLAPQGALWVEGFFAILLAGASAVPLSHLHPDKERRWFVEASRSEALLSAGEYTTLAESCSQGYPILDIPSLVETSTLGPTPEVSDDFPATILYTSGTTGKPKGALISHGNLASLAELLQAAWGWSTSDVLLHCLPLHHLHGLGISLLTSLLAGSSTRMLQRFDAARLWESMGECQVLMGVPTMHKKLLDALDAAPPKLQERWRSHAGGLRLITSGSAALPTTLGERWRTLTGQYPLERFGMTEIGVGMSNPIDGERRPGSCGLPLPGMEIRIVGESGQEVSPGEPGEIWIRGPSVFTSYDGDTVATSKAFADGWFKSGDTATWLEGGYAKILGRTSVDILKSGGYKLSALEIEEVLRENPAVADVAVVGIPDETWGEMAVAVVISRPGKSAELEQARLRQWAKERIAAYKVPQRVFVMDDFPRNPVGKVLKPELKRLLAARLGASL